MAGHKVYVLAMPNSRAAKAKKPPNSKGASDGVFGHPLRVAIYARVSAPGQHTIAMQKRQLREYAKRRDWTIVREVEEVGSGAKRRPKRDELVDAARRREIDAVLVWRLDRWGRSLSDLVVTLQELQELGVAFVSLTEADCDRLALTPQTPVNSSVRGTPLTVTFDVINQVSTCEPTAPA